MLFSDPLHAPLHTLPCAEHDYPHWHHGRKLYAVWTLEVDQPAILNRWHRAHSHLQDWLLPGNRRQPHITLGAAGFCARQARLEDDLCLSALAELRRDLRQHPPPAVKLSLGGLDSFASAAFLTVTRVEGSLDALRARLCPQDERWRDSAYHPHLTVGLYAAQIDGPQVRQRLAQFGHCPPLELACSHVSLSVYRSRTLQGRLRCLERFRFALD